ncbi:DUF6463 family protein [Nonomuraea sp. NPDC005501]|uniref:DUF6463 family protein n=1 Tax=Nonomuraea sp. NPDC005501 TaxID=3156884 RepID=UPI0033A0490D
MRSRHGRQDGKPPVTALTRWIPRLLIAIALVHFVWAFVKPNAWAALAADGFVRALVDLEPGAYFAREASVWFLAAGIALLALGTLSRHLVRTTDRVPAQLGWYPVAIGVLALLAAHEPLRADESTKV